MAHKIIYEGREYPLHILTLCDDGAVSIAPFTGEEHSVPFVNGTVRVSVSGNPPKLIIEKAG